MASNVPDVEAAQLSQPLQQPLINQQLSGDDLLPTPDLVENIPPVTAPIGQPPGPPRQQGAFRGTAALANLLPTGTMLFFQILSPIFTNGGMCDPVFQNCTATLLILCAISCWFVSFTDSFVDEENDIKYGIATINGLWPLDLSPPPKDALRYRIHTVDVIHAIMTVVIFVAIAIVDPRVFLCLYPTASSYETLVLKLVPLGIAFFCSVVFLIIPTERKGIGY
ncbi:hypothetical protein ZOSMA_313G00010 [Zostera marina]|uniref:Transmembrane protein n=1 Tax=Zostera marina TaxID=29655 RepID=A0A0K9P9M1_ZOSMR|nr:hypothetical protein ZOSMA_313G00010 [Zostera marina]